MSARSPDHSWLRLRVRLLCIAVFAVSLVLPAYVPEPEAAPPDDVAIEEAHGFLLTEEGFLMKTSPLTAQGTRTAFTRGVLHIVESGESIASIARLAGISEDTVRWANALGPKDNVRPGQSLLLLPVDGVLHTVKRGQNLQAIADLYGVPAQNIVQQNAVRGGYLLAGQQLIVPGGKPVVERPVVAVASSAPARPAVASSAPSAAKKPSVDLAKYNIETTYGIFQMPCDCFYTQYFGSSHYGVDLQHRGGAPIYAGEGGKVIRADYGWNGGYGNVIELDHGNGLVTLYAHNKELYVNVGDHVQRGQVISFMGNTGRVHGPTGIHLHFEVHVHGVKKNPRPYLQQ